MKYYFRTSIYVLFLLSVTACGTMRLDVQPTADRPVQGILYVLPMTTFDITVKRYLAKCRPDGFDISHQFEIQDRLVEDPLNIYHIDPQSLSGGLNTSNVNVAFHEGTRYLKSINSEVKSEVGTLLNSVVKAIGGVRTVGLGGQALGTAAAPKRVLKCSKEIEKVISELKKQEKKVATITAEVHSQKSILDVALLEQARALPESTDSINANVIAKQRTLELLTGMLDDETSALKAARIPLFMIEKTKWTPSVEVSKPTEISAGSKKILKRWLIADSNGIELALTDSEIETLLSQMLVRAEVASASGIGRSVNASEKRLKPWRTKLSGVYYRNPVNATLKLTRIINLVEDILLAMNVTVLQQGYVHSLAVVNEPFESTEFSAEFALNGALITTQSKKTLSIATGVGSALDTASAEFIKFKNAELSVEQGVVAAQLASLKSELELLTVRKQILDFEDTDSESELESILSQTTLLLAKIAKIEAETKLAEIAKGE